MADGPPFSPRLARSPRGPGGGPKGQNWVGRRFEVTVGPVAHGGHCVARAEGRVVFVRHALPGERVVVEVTEDKGGSFCRADAVAVPGAGAVRAGPPRRLWRLRLAARLRRGAAVAEGLGRRRAVAPAGR